MIIAKFGGTSVNTKERVETLCKIVSSELDKQPVVVVSAIRGVTDSLLLLPTLPASKIKNELIMLKNTHINLAAELLPDNFRKKVNNFINEKINEIAHLSKKKNFNKASMDNLVSFGEIMSSYLITQVFLAQGIKAAQIIAANLITTDNNFGSAEFLLEPTRLNIKKVLVPLVKKGIVPVVTGFIGATKTGEKTTLGRGGSDYTASIIGFCLKASEIQIWTDVDGIFTADPKIAGNARFLPLVSFKEASELATFGARVLHPRTIKPAISANIPVRVLNTANPDNSGTLIKEKIKVAVNIRAIAFKKNINLVNIFSMDMLLQKGFLARVFKIFADSNISIDLVSVSEVSISVTLDNSSDNLQAAAKKLSEFAGVSIVQNLGMISLIGEGITSESETIKRIFEILDKEKILVRMISLGAANINISIVVGSDQVETGVRALHDRLLLKQIQKVIQ